MVPLKRNFITYGLLVLIVLLNAAEGELARSARDLQQESCDRSSTPGVKGEYENVIAKIILPEPGRNLVEIELIYDVNLFSGSLNKIDFPLFFHEFGNFQFSSISAEVQVNDQVGDIYFEVEAKNVRNSDLIEADFCFGRKISTSFSVRIKFSVEDMICQIEGENALFSSWFSQLTTVNTKHVEIDYSVLLGDQGFDNTFQARISPSSNRAIRAREDIDGQEFLTVFVPYTPGEIRFGERDKQDSYMLLGNQFYSNLNECASIESPNILIYVIAAIPALSCCCLCALGISQFIMDRNDMRRRRNFRWFTRFNLFQTNPDIVLAPEHDGIDRQATVRAVPESQLTGATTAIDVNISHYIQDGDDVLRGTL